MGLFIAIEGGDGSGKGTQTRLLVEYYKQMGVDVLEVDFPQYSQDSSLYVTRYLNGEYGAADEVPADLASLAFALDRFSARDTITAHLNRPDSIVIANRYVASNLAHQGSRITDSVARKQFYDEIQHLEFDIFGIARPDLSIVLLVPPDISQLNVDKKAKRSYTKLKRDIHEEDIDHLERARANYEELCSLYPSTYVSVNCYDSRENSMLSEHTILEKIKRLVEAKRQ